MNRIKNLGSTAWQYVPSIVPDSTPENSHIANTVNTIKQYPTLNNLYNSKLNFVEKKGLETFKVDDSTKINMTSDPYAKFGLKGLVATSKFNSYLDNLKNTPGAKEGYQEYLKSLGGKRRIKKGKTKKNKRKKKKYTRKTKNNY
jgi:hypothetical protein